MVQATRASGPAAREAAPGTIRLAGIRPPRPTLHYAAQRRYRRPGGPWDGGTLDALLSAPGVAYRHRLVDGEGRAGGRELAPAVDDLAGRLRRAGVRHGDAVAWQLPNGLPAAVLCRACWRLGAVAVPVHPATGQADLAAALAQVGPRLVLGSAGTPAAALPGAVVVAVGTGAVEAPATLAAFEALAPAPPVPVAASLARPADLALAIFTSGSTGRPKAVLHSQRGLAWLARSLAAAHGLGPHDVLLAPAPMAHVAGLLAGVVLPAATGAGAVLMGRWDPDRAVVLVERERVTFASGPPTFFVGLLEAGAFQPERVASLRLVSVGGAPVAPGFVDIAGEALGCRVKRTYGSSEAPMVTTGHPGDAPRDDRETDGRPVGGVELLVVDPAGGTRQPPGSTGELWVRGPQLFAGYADPAETAAAVARGGWYRTGDLATLDAGGHLQVVGRLRDLVIRGGENIAATEVEAALAAHPAVRQAAVVPYPDPLMGERVGAAVVADGALDLDGCRDWVAGQGLARHKLPERLLHLEAMPTLPSGKADRVALRALMARTPPPCAGEP